MELIEAIQQRRSIHEFKTEEVEEAILKEVFSTAAWAPNHRMKQPWQIHMYQNKAKEDYSQLVVESYEREGFFSSYKEEKANQMKQGIRQFLNKIPHHALVYMERDSDDHKFEEDYAAVCAFVQNVQLLAWEKGIGALWTTSPYLHDPLFIKGIGLDVSSHKLVAVIQMGYPERIPQAKKRVAIGNKVSFFHDSFPSDK